MGGVISEARICELFHAELDAVQQEIGGVHRQLEHQTLENDAVNRWWQELRSKVYFTAGKFHHVPDGWVFPQGMCAVMWLSWVCAEEKHCIAPLNLFTTVDVNHLKRGKQKLSELKWLMTLVENEAKKQGIWKEELTAIKANFMYRKVFESITKDLGHRHCGLGVLSWQHVYNLLKTIEC